jgi:PD-(D/E)XK nuclease superfamily
MDGVLALYPTARKVEDWLKRQSRDRRCLLGYSVMTFPQLVDRLWREFGPRGALLDDLGERLTACEALAASGNAIGSSHARADHMLGLIRQFKSAAIEPADVGSAAAALDARSDASRLRAFAAVFARYEETLSRHGMCDRHDRERTVLEGLIAIARCGERPAMLDGIGQLHIAEIYDFSLIQFMIVTALIRIVGDARLTIQVAEHPADTARFAELTWNRFVAEESIADKVLPDFVRRDGRPGWLGFALEHLFTETDVAAPPADTTLEIVEAPTPLAEIEEVARSIRRAMEEPQPIALARIAVVARDLAPYAEDLRMVFRRYRIPLDLGEAPPLRATPPARLIEDMLRSAREDLSREALAAILRSPHLGAGAPATLAPMLIEVGYIDRGARPLMECIDAHVRGLHGALEQASDATERGKIEARIRHTEQTRASFERLLGAIAPMGAPGTLVEHLDRLGRALKALDFDPADACNRSDAAARAFGPVRAALDGLARYAVMTGAERTLDAAEFAAMVEAAFDGAAAPDTRVTSGAVSALPVPEARGLDFDLVFVIGLNDGVFPIYHREDPLLPDGTKLALNRPLGGVLRRRFGQDAPSRPGHILRTCYDRNGEDFLLFHLALSMPSRRAVLSYAGADTAGNPMVRSPFVDEILRMLGDPRGEVALRRISATSLVPAVSECFSREEFLARAAADGMLGVPEADVIAPRAALDSILSRTKIEIARDEYLSMPAREENPDADESGMRYTPDERKFKTAGPFDGCVRADARLARMLVGTPQAPRAWSASKLDELAACGFKFFVSRVLALREEDEPDYELSALEGGELMHEVLRRLVEKRVDFRDRERAHAGAERVLDAVYGERQPLARDPGFFDLRWASVRRTVGEFVEFQIADCARRPGFDVKAEHDVRFALSHLRAPNRAPLWIEGRIDRLELRPARCTIAEFRVIDYKNSRNADRYRKMADSEGEDFGWTSFQLPVYLMGALSEFSKRLADNAALEAGYLILRDGDKLQVKPVKRELVDPDPVRRAKAAAAGANPIAERILDLVDSALGGRFDVDPRRCDEWCPYRTVCRYDGAQAPGA